MKLFLIRLTILLLIISIIFSFSPQPVLAERVTIEDSPFMDGDPTLPQSDQTKETYELLDCSEVTDIQPEECQALLDFYESTNGDGWNNQQECSGDENDNCWLATTKIDQWYGVTVDGGHVSFIELYGNNLIGEIPATISQLSYLIELCLTSNKISGVIPDSISQISTLERLSLDSNDLSGSIPESLSSMPNLTKISLGHNQITGTIPASLGDLTALTRLEIHDNYISGELPESLGKATNLQYLIIFSNPLEGSIPFTYTNLTNVTDFYFFKTHLCEPTTPEFLAWKALVGAGWHGTDMICLDYSIFLPIILK